MTEFLIQGRRLIQIVEVAIYLDPLEALLAQLNKFLAVFTLAVADDGGQQIGPRALFHRHDPVDHVLHLLGLDRLARGGAIGRADAGEEQTQVVVDLGHSADGRPRVLRRGFLLDRDGGAEAGDVIHIRLLHHIKELPRIGRERFHIAPLPFGIDRVEGKARLAGTRKPGDYNQLVPWNIHVDVLQIVLARAAHFNILQLSHHMPLLTICT